MHTFKKHGARAPSAAGGFTLIEVMIAVAIVAIVMAVAIPSYRDHVTRTNRVAAEGCLSQLGQFMERVYATNVRYDQNNGAATTLPALQCGTDLSGKYSFSFPSGSPTQRAFTVQAVPQGGQATADSGCGTLTLNQQGTKGVSGATPVAQCWR